MTTMFNDIVKQYQRFSKKEREVYDDAFEFVINRAIEKGDKFYLMNFREKIWYEVKDRARRIKQ